MQFNFDQEIISLINEISEISEKTAETKLLMKPLRMIKNLENKINKQKDSKVISPKKWTRIRRQVSWMFEFINPTEVSLSCPAYVPVKTQVEDTNSDGHRIVINNMRRMIKIMSEIKNNQGMNNYYTLFVSLRYGVVTLDDSEIKLLIANNLKNNES